LDERSILNISVKRDKIKRNKWKRDWLLFAKASECYIDRFGNCFLASGNEDKIFSHGF
jgi:hypothetical protein